MKSVSPVSCCSVLLSALLAVLLLSGVAFADYIEGFVHLATEFTDNATKRETEKLSERQDKVSLGARGTYKNDVVDFSADYVYSDYRFQHESQPDRTTLEGSSTLYFGHQSKIIDVTLVHSRRGIIGSPEQLDLLRNYDEREIISVFPALNVAITPVDMLSLGGSFSDINYRHNPLRDSRHKGANLTWQHRLSPIDSFSLSAARSDISFNHASEKDYTYYSSLLAYSAALRKLRYSISGGYNKTENERTADYSSPSYQANVAYTSEAGGVSLYVNRAITDTSMGDGNRESIGTIGSGDVGSNTIDQIDRRTFELEAFSPLVCRTCSVSLQVRWRKDNYLELPQDNSERGITLGFNYQVSPLTRIDMRANWREQRYSSAIDGRTSNVDRQTFSVTRQLNHDIDLRWYLDRERRRSRGNAFNYDELSSGLAVNFRF